MRIAFRLDADAGIGMGHAARCAALARALVEKGGECVYFCRSNPETVAFAQEACLALCPVPKLSLMDESAWLCENLKGFDALVLDSYALSDEYIHAMNAPGRVVCCVDDNALYTYGCDIVLNGNLHARELTYRFGEKKPLLMLGGRYTLLRRAFRDAAPIEVKERGERIFLCMGGSDLRDFTPRALAALQDIPGVHIVVILGAMTACDRRVRALAKANVRVEKNLPDFAVAERMRECDVAVTSGGGIVYESATVGLPSVIVSQAENQDRICAYMAKKGLMKSMGDCTPADLQALRSAVQELLSDEPRRRRESAALKKAIALDGADAAAKVIVGRIKEGRG
jgi:UDP-2,4-diacetamido-2,4,6-trideoxy-beta-L-altropyranose hydrolase